MADTTMTPRRRRRPAVSCILCRRRKQRCNRESPCSNCIKSGNAPCVYDAFAPVLPSSKAASASMASQKRLSSASVADAQPSGRAEADAVLSGAVQQHPPPLSLSASSSEPATTAATTARETSSISSVPPSQADTSSLWDMASPVSGLSNEQQKPLHDVVDELTSRIAGDFQILEDRTDNPAHRGIPRSVTHKSRTFGQSHWIGASLLFRDLMELMEPHLQTNQNNLAGPGLKRCKTLARAIKSARSPEWPTVPTSQLPARDIADQLVQNYLQTSETIYRVVHIPSFMRDYEAVWAMRDTNGTLIRETVPEDTPSEAKDSGFLIQLKLVLAIGAVTHDDTFTLRASAIRWVYEAQTWFAEPKFKSRMLSLQSLQTNILLLLAQELVDISGDSVWIGSGSLMRRSIHMGLHRDPSHLPRAPLLVTEMRRRLWNTILELNLQFCISAGTPPGISLDDFDTLPPGNFDDDQLGDPTASPPVFSARAGTESGKYKFTPAVPSQAPQPENTYTQTAIALALRHTLPVRLKTARSLNNVRSTYSTYAQALRLDGELRTAYRDLCHTLHGYTKSLTKNKPGAFELRAVDLLLQRYLSSLHIPYIQASLHEKAYAYSRKAALESALKMWYLVCPPQSSTSTILKRSSRTCRLSPPHYAAPEQAQETSAVTDGKMDTLARFTICGYGFFRTTITRVSLIVAKEMQMQRLEEQGLGPSMPMRPDLVDVIESGAVWHFKCLEAGETNMKGYLLAHGVAVYLGAMDREEIRNSGNAGQSQDELVQVLLAAMRDAIDVSLPMLEEQARRYGAADVPSGGQSMDGVVGRNEIAVTEDGGWNMLMTDAMLDVMPEDDPMGWMLNDEAMASDWLWS